MHFLNHMNKTYSDQNSGNNYQVTDLLIHSCTSEIFILYKKNKNNNKKYTTQP